ncbi:MAG: hypothetical protein J5580_02155, partial [Clostridia bacterium]|nr:hypothetical protein [Clostridia bacterium]
MGGKHLKKRGLASLFIVSIIAIAAVLGVVFAFKNSGRQNDVYANISVVAEPKEINLNIEVVDDDSEDNGIMIDETADAAYEFLTITVGGLPSNSDRRVFVDDGAIYVDIERYGDEITAKNTGVNIFKITGKKAGSESLRFSTIGDQSVTVKVKVDMVAKYMTIGKGADGNVSHFGIRQGGEPLELKSSAILSKFDFYAHVRDVANKIYSPNQYPVIYRLMEGQNYKGVTLTENGFLTVSEDAECVDQYIYLQAQVPAMGDEWVDVPVYVFPKVADFIITPSAYKAATTGNKTWDLIKNREGSYASADFSFELKHNQSIASDYGVIVESDDTTMVRVDPAVDMIRADAQGKYICTLSPTENLGTTKIRVKVCPIIKGQDGRDIEFTDESDTMVQFNDEFNVRVRYEFKTNAEVGNGESFNLKATTNKINAAKEEYLDAFFYEGGSVSNYHDEFILNTANGKVVNMDADVEFELLVEDSDPSGEYSGIYRRDGHYTMNGERVNHSGNNDWNLYTILDIGYWSEVNKNWVRLSPDNYFTHYKNKFSVAFRHTGNAEKMLQGRISSLILRVKSVEHLSLGDDIYATCDIRLERTCAIDELELSNLCQLDNGTQGVALVYDTVSKSFVNSATVRVKGLLANGTYSENWNMNKVLDNGSKLPFDISVNRNVPFEYNGISDSYYCIEYTIAADDIDAIDYYKDYPMTITYPNGISSSFNICVYPTVGSLSMPVVSGSQGKIYQTVTNSDGIGYDYARVVYVRKGYDYQFNVITPGVNVGASAVFDKIVSHVNDEVVYDENGKIIARTHHDVVVYENTTNFDATQLPEGLYECTVSLNAYSQDVYEGHDTEFPVYFIVVDPVGSVTPSSAVNLKGIGDSEIITLDISDLNRKSITSDGCLQIDLVEGNENILIEEQYNNKFNQYKITAKYLTNNSFKLGFKVYKKYDFTDINLDGKEGLQNEKPFVFNYNAGNSVTVTVNIGKEKLNSLNLFNHPNDGGDFVKDSGASDGYFEMVSSSNKAGFEITGSQVDVKVSDSALNPKIGIAYAEWVNGKFEIAPFPYGQWVNGEFKILNNNEFTIPNVATVTLSDAYRIVATPVAGQKSIGQYAIVVYPCDSLRYVKTEGNVEYALPDLTKCKKISLYVASDTTLTEFMKDKNLNIPHDANSGRSNTLGGYNWIIRSQNHATQVAALTYTTGDKEYTDGDTPEANVYYFDDLYTVLGWGAIYDAMHLGDDDSVIIEKFVDGVKVGEKSLLLKDNPEAERNRLKLNLNDYKFQDNPNDLAYSNGSHNVYLKIYGQNAYFYLVEGIERFDVKMQNENSNITVAQKNLSPDKFTNEVDNVVIQRGSRIDFVDELKSGWKMDKSDFEADKANARSIDYEGGIYAFVPYIEFKIDSNITYKFVFDALRAKVKVDVDGGIKYLNFTQNGSQSDGVSTATYYLNVCTDQIWSSDLLNFTFLYEGVYYDLFKDNPNVAYINLEGGKAKLEFKLTCLNRPQGTQNIPSSPSFYINYSLQIDVAVVIVTPDVNPFYDINGSRLFVRENLAGSPLAKTKTPLESSTSFDLVRGSIENVTLAHFAETNAVAGNKNALTLSKNQTDSGIIYLDDTAVGGLLKVRPTPYYINVADIVVKTVFEDNSGYYDVPIGTDLNGNAITERVRYSIDFIQMIYNEDEGYYQPYLLGVNRPKMVSTWSRLEGYKWDGYYYFKTVLKLESNSQITYRVPNGTRFTIEVSITGENGTTITEHMTLFARYRDSFSVGSGDEIEDYPVRTMLQTQYQALGTTAVYDIAMPTDCNPNFAAFTLNGISGSTATIKSNYIEVTIDAKAKTLSVHLEANARAIGASFEVRIPYNRPGDYINPYLSVVIVPVYFAFDQLEVVDHYETVIQAVSEEAIMNLKYRASFVYDAGMSGAGLTEKMAEFNQSMLNSSAVQCGYDKTQKQISVNVVYAYVNGVPVLSRDGDCRYAQTFAYELKQPDALVKHKEYLAVGTTTTYTFHDWDPLHATKLTLRSNGNPTAISSYWNCDAKPVVVKTQNGYDVSITVSLENRSNTVSNETAYDALVSAGGIVIYVDSSASVQPLMELTIVPVYFTFDEFKLQNNPVRPLVALSTPTIVTVEAGGITRASSSVVTTKINTFNNELLAAQENLNSSNAVLSFTREKSGNNVLNFDFNSRTRALTRSDLSNPVTATSYLLVTAAVDYVNGVPTLSRSGEKKISTYIPVRTFGTESENNGTSETDLEPAPNGRERTVAQAIGTKGYYNVALPNTVYDSKLDKYEIRADNTYLWEKNFNWNATLNTKEKVITVTLDETTALFNTTLVIKAYNQDGELMYKLNIIPAYFTVENIFLAEHIDENPILIKDGNPNWVKELALDFKSSRSNSISPIIANFNFATYMNSFRQALNSSNLVARIDDSGYVTIVTGVNFENGIPTIASTSNSALVLQDTYRYELYDGVPVNTKAQAIGNTITYNVNRTYQTIKIFDSNTATWLDNYIPDGAVWKVDEVEDDNNTHEKRRVKVVLSESTSVIGHPIRIGIFKNEGDVEPDYILNIIPAYFTVEDLTVKDQNSEDRDIYLYYGFKPDSPRDLIFDPVIADNYSTNLVNDDMINTFKEKFQGIDAVNIVRDYDSNLNAGDLHVTAFLDYTTGVPELVTEANADVACVVRVSADFWYSIFGHNGGEGKYPYLPNGPRTRTEVQAVGTVAKYKIDLNQTLTMTDTVLVYDENLMAERGWKATFANNIFTLELLSDVNAVSKLVGANATDLVFKFYAGSKTAYVLTIQPVLFEVLGIESYAPEQPIYVSSDGDDALNTLMYRAVVKYNDSAQYKASESAEPEDVVAFVNTLNNNLNTESRQFLNIDKVEINGKYYLKLDAAIDYGVAGSNRRRTPYLVDIESNPLNVVESYLEYIVAERPITTEAKHNQAIGTTEYYYLGSAFRNISQSDISVMVDNVVSASATVTLVENYGGQDATALKVVLAKDEALVNQSVTVEISYLDGSRASTFTMEIQPVWFVVEGFEVVNHPERHMWLIISDAQEEKVSDLIYNARVRYAVDANNTLLEKIQTRIDAFNAKLVTGGEEGWADLLDIETIGSQYVEVRAAVKYGTDGVAVVEAINENNLSAVVYDVFKYNRYINKVKSSGIAYPNVPRSRTVEITVGYEADYTLDIPNLGALSSDLIALYYNDNRIYADDDSKLQRYTSEAVNHWAVSVVGNNLHVALHADIALANSELKVFVYKDRVYVPGENEKPNSSDIDKVAYILTIRPVLFKVTDFALVGYNKDEIHVADIDNFTKDISDGINTKFVPVYEYTAGLLDTVVDTAQGTKLVDLMNNFTDRFVSSPYVAKIRSSIENDVYQFQVTTSVIYNAYEGKAILSDDAECRLWKSFKVVVENVPTNSTIRDEYQTIGSIKTYYIDDSVLTDTTTEPSGAGYTATWSRDDNDDIKKNYLNVTLDDSVTVGTPVMVEIGNCTLRINPVYYEVLGFEPVQHPERAAWVVEPETTDDLEYRMIITDISYLAGDAFAGVRAAVNANIETWNLKLNNGEAPKTVNLTDGQLIVFDAAVNYDKTTGYPKFVEIDKDKRNVVESIIKYRVWSAAQMPNPEHPLVMGKSEAYQVLGKTKAYTLRNIRGQISYQYLWAESAGDLITAFDDSIDGVTAVYEKMTIMVDVALNIVKIQLPANPNIRDTMRIYIPYSTAINGKEVWYSYCLEITPILFELRGWTIAGISQKDGYPVTYTANHPDVIGLYVSHLRNDCILLTKQSDESTKIRYVALVNRSNDALLASQIDRAIAELEANAVTYINGNYLRIDKLTNYIVFNGDSLVRNYPAEQSSESEVTFSCYVVYRNGLPELVLNSNISVSNQILIATGSEIANFEDANNDRVFDHLGETVVQAVGTSATYTMEILNAVKIFTDQIEIWDCSDNNTHNPLQIRGERANLASFVVDDIIDENIVLTVDLAPVAGLCDKLIAVSIPYAKNDYALKPTDCYIIYIKPVIFTVEGFYLTGVEDNNLSLDEGDAVLELNVVANYSDEVSLRNFINLNIQSFETALNNAIRNQTIVFDNVENIENVSGGVNVHFQPMGNRILIQKIDDLTAVNTISKQIRIGYATGIPTVGGLDEMTDADIDLQISVSTTETPKHIDLENMEVGESYQTLQSIGSSVPYPLSVTDPNVIFYYENIDVFKGGLKRGDNEYEFFHYEVISSDRRNVTLNVTLRAAARNLNDYIEIRIPYTKFIGDETHWFYYSLQI